MANKKYSEKEILGLLMEVVALGKAGKPYKASLNKLKKALKDNPSMREVIGKSINLNN